MRSWRMNKLCNIIICNAADMLVVGYNLNECHSNPLKPHSVATANKSKPMSKHAYSHLPTNTTNHPKPCYILPPLARPTHTYSKHQHAHRAHPPTESHSTCINTITRIRIHTYTYRHTWRHILEVKMQSTVHHVLQCSRRSMSSEGGQ